MGENLGSAIKAFQRSRQLPENGIIGPETWQILNQDTDPALQPYTIAAEDVAGPFTRFRGEWSPKKTSLLGLSVTGRVTR